MTRQHKLYQLRVEQAETLARLYAVDAEILRLESCVVIQEVAVAACREKARPNAPRRPDPVPPADAATGRRAASHHGASPPRAFARQRRRRVADRMAGPQAPKPQAPEVQKPVVPPVPPPAASGLRQQSATPGPSTPPPLGEGWSKPDARPRYAPEGAPAGPGGHPEPAPVNETRLPAADSPAPSSIRAYPGETRAAEHPRPGHLVDARTGVRLGTRAESVARVLGVSVEEVRDARDRLDAGEPSVPLGRVLVALSYGPPGPRDPVRPPVPSRARTRQDPPRAVGSSSVLAGTNRFLADAAIHDAGQPSASEAGREVEDE